MNKTGRVSWYARYVLLLLLLAYLVSYMDRIALSILVQPIQQDLALSDTKVSLLIGLAFVLLYSTMGVPLGRLADRGNRPLLIAAGMMVWCAATVACGFATGFASLLAARILVGLGEATLSPSSYSLIASYFPRERLATATSVYSLGVTFGGGLATYAVASISGLAADLHLLPDGGTGAWRTSFVLVGLMGLPVLLLFATVREPRRHASAAARVSSPPVAEVARHIRANADGYGLVLGGYVVMAISSLGIVLWGPTFYARVHGFSTAAIGSTFGLAMAVFGTAGLLLGGWLVDRLFARGRVDAAPRVVIGSLLLQTPLFAALYLVPDARMAEGLLYPAVFAMLLQGGLQGASIQLIAPERMRGVIVALFLMAANIIGMALGPLLIAQVGEAFGGGRGIGPALAIVTVATSLGGAALIAAGLGAFRRMAKDAARGQPEINQAGTTRIADGHTMPETPAISPS